MDTLVLTPNKIFVQPQLLLVPLFQRPYVWNEEFQWAPLWKDLERVAGRLLDKPSGPQTPHFLGAVVLQQLLTPSSNLPQRTIIDGQQRLTTLQLLLDALHSQIESAGESKTAKRLASLIENDDSYRNSKDDRFKVRPTNRDRPAFDEVMQACSPVDYSKLEHASSRMAKAHRYFSERCREWLYANGESRVATRAEAIERSARDFLQIVVIDLNAGENAQEIFETLNARGSVLTAADLIKNFVFQRLMEQGSDVEEAYEKYWKQFETAFWEQEVSVGRASYQRSSVFLNHWLVAQTGEEILAREVFSSFKQYADFSSSRPMIDILREIHRAAGIYRNFTEQAEQLDGPLDRIGLFAYRAKTLESEVIKPALLVLLTHPSGALPQSEIDSSLEAIESWLARRMLIRATAKSYNKIIAELISILRNTAPSQVSAAVKDFFSAQRTEIGYWPDDAELRRELLGLPIYRKLSRGRLRMVLESIEDHWRGWTSGQVSAAGMRVRRGSFAIEHLMPQSWGKNWPLPPSVPESERDARIHRLGNLTLLTKKLNSTVSNGPWLGPKGKAAHLQGKDVLLLNSRIIKDYQGSQWAEPAIDARTSQAIDAILAIWPVPRGHQVNIDREKFDDSVSASVSVSDLISAGIVKVGQSLYSTPGKYGGHVAMVLSDGRIEFDGVTYDSLSQAGIAARKQKTNGWYFWRLKPNGQQQMRAVREEYLNKIATEGVN